MLRSALLLVLLALSILRVSQTFFLPLAPAASGERSGERSEIVAHELLHDWSLLQDHGVAPRLTHNASPGAPLLVTPYSLWAHGHFLFLHHSRHGVHGLHSLVRAYTSRGIPVDAVVLDAFWWHPRRLFAPHPQHYPRGFLETSSTLAGETDAVVRLLVWVSALIPTSTAEYEEARRRSFLLTTHNRSEVHVLNWRRNDGPALSGGLVDFSSAEAVKWFGAAFASFLRANPAVHGVRCAGVDALVAHEPNLFGRNGHVDGEQYRRSYYRFFQSTGLAVRDEGLSSFLVVGRAVDTFGEYHFQTFAPADALYAGFVGDHPFTFSGLRESAMNVLHSARACYVSVGSLVGGSFVEDEERLHEAFRQWDAGEAAVEAGLHESGVDYGSAKRSYLAAEQRLQGGGGRHDPSCEAAVRERRRAELFQRWLQFSSYLPFFSNGGLAGAHLPWMFGSEVEQQYRDLVHEHRALALYYAMQSAQWARTRWDSHPRRGDDDDGDQAACPMVPLRRRKIDFEEPLLPTGWSLLVGRDLLLVPTLHSFGASAPPSLGDPLQRDADGLDPRLLRRRSATIRAGVEEWVLVAEPQVVALRVVDDRAVEAEPSLSNRAVASSPGAPPLVLRRRSALVPLLSPQSPLSSLVDAVVVFTSDGGTGSNFDASIQTPVVCDESDRPSSCLPSLFASVAVNAGSHRQPLLLTVSRDDDDDGEANCAVAFSLALQPSVRQWAASCSCSARDDDDDEADSACVAVAAPPLGDDSRRYLHQRHNVSWLSDVCAALGEGGSNSDEGPRVRCCAHVGDERVVLLLPRVEPRARCVCR